ncbi:MAG: periplasmic-binding protein-like II family lipoprotein [Firmicutes bacterium HGW-Firmicutes-15]|nr:MAG: periplasmic-binding protein-like II family lipoprotein [Firmicutes bacterium HGW-Firmicutes-15]
MLKTKRKGIILFTLLCFFATLASGCSSSKKTATVKDDYVVKLGYYNCDHMTAACIAKDAGMFEKLGVTVEVTGNGEVPKAMAAGSMDVGYVGITGLRLAYGKGGPVFVAANNHLGGSSYLVASNSIKEAKDLIGKKLAIGSKAHETSPGWVSMATRLGIPVDVKNYQAFDMKDSDEYLAMKTGNLDAYSCCDPWGSMAEYEGTGHVLAVDTKLPNGTWGDCCVYAMSNKFAQEHPDLAKKMLLAHTQAIEYIYVHPLKSAKIFANNYKVPEEVALMTIYKKTIGEGRTLSWVMDRQAVDDTFENAKAIGVKDWLDYKSDPKFIDTTLLDQSKVDDFNKFISEKVDPVFPLTMSYDDWKKKAAEIDV